MISKLKILNPSNTPIEYLASVPWLSKPCEFEFTSGLNVIIGPNGSGKSTLVKLIAALTHCKQGGYPKITAQSLHCLRGKMESVEIEGPIGPVYYCDPNETPGLVGGMAGFDYDFVASGVMFATFKGSHGQNTLTRLKQILEAAGTAKQELGKFSDKGISVRYVGGFGTRTILLDEADRSMDMGRQLDYWNTVQLIARTCQVICISHNPISLLSDTNFIETEPGYLNKCRQMVEKSMFEYCSRVEHEPRPLSLGRLSEDGSVRLPKREHYGEEDANG